MRAGRWRGKSGPAAETSLTSADGIFGMHTVVIRSELQEQPAHLRRGTRALGRRRSLLVLRRNDLVEGQPAGAFAAASALASSIPNDD